MADKGKRKLEEETGVNTESNVVDEYDSDHEMYVGKSRMSRENRNAYWRQVDESEGFDITLDLDLGARIVAPIVPIRHNKNGPTYSEISRLAIATYNSENNTRYEFVENLSVTASLAAGYWCRNTFLARDSDAPNNVKTFQGLGFWGISGERKIQFCRLKKTSSGQGDECPPDSNVDEKAAQ
ncbi:uncharacterized protein LOC124895653 [Capsicum annuum]|uniref:uncharacterized protein LOC124895653 n=1 Tax=Capsicum annuum TaxID=4072 RepID=UPI001FB16297|nr:uncharacterized protein LOC124895653 [Capsicum annuum]